MRRIILNLHLYGALIAGLFLVVLGATGSIMAFEEELDSYFNAKLFKVEPRSEALSVTDVLKALGNAYPGNRFTTLRLPAGPSGAYIAQAGSKQIFVNGYTGAIIGEREMPTLLSRIHQIHITLFAGKWGGQIGGWASVLSVCLILSGVYLWWPLKATATKLGSSKRGLNFELHNLAGIYFALFLLVLSLTAIVLAFEGVFNPLFYKVTRSSPPERFLPSTVESGAKPITADDAIRLAKIMLPGASPHLLFAPRDPRGSYVVYMRFPEDLTAGRSWVTLDQYSGKALVVESSRTPPAGAGIINFNRALHTGDLYGYPTKILMSLSSLMLVVQAITGYCIWWKKLRKSARKPVLAAVADPC